MQWEKVLPDDHIYFAPCETEALIDNRFLYISTWGPSSPRGVFFRVRPGSWDREDVYSQIQSLKWNYAAVGLPSDTDTSRPLEPQHIGPMTRVYKEVHLLVPPIPPGRMVKRPYHDLYVCAMSPIYKFGSTFAGNATVVYEGGLTLPRLDRVGWTVETVLPGYITDPEIIGFKGYIFVSLRQAEIGTNASGVWGKAGQEIRASNPENEAVSSFYSSSDVLYAGTWGNRRQNSGAEIWKTTTGMTWELEHSFSDPAEWGVTSMTEFRSNLYAGTQNHTTGTHIWRRENANEWRNVTPDWASVTHAPAKTRVLRSYGDALYAAGGPPPIISMSKDGVTWDFDTAIQQADGNNYVIMDLDWFNDSTYPFGPPALFAGVGNQITGVQLWRASGQ